MQITVTWITLGLARQLGTERARLQKKNLDKCKIKYHKYQNLASAVYSRYPTIFTKLVASFVGLFCAIPPPTDPEEMNSSGAY